jgi:hypothetical protein
MSKKESSFAVTGRTSFNSHTARCVNDGSDGGRIEVEFDNLRGYRNTMHVIGKGGSGGKSLDEATEYFNREYSESYTRSDVKTRCDRLVKCGYAERLGTRKNPIYRLTKGGYERFKKAKKIVK